MTLRNRYYFLNADLCNWVGGWWPGEYKTSRVRRWLSRQVPAAW